MYENSLCGEEFCISRPWLVAPCSLVSWLAAGTSMGEEKAGDGRCSLTLL